MLDPWRTCLRAILRAERDDGQLWVSDRALAKLAAALASNDATLIQGETIDTKAMLCTLDWPVDGACLVGYCGWADGLETVGEVEEYFAEVCFAADAVLGEPAGVRFFLKPYDDWSRDEMRRNLGPEIALERDRRSMLRGCAGDVQRVERVGV